MVSIQKPNSFAFVYVERTFFYLLLLVEEKKNFFTVIFEALY